MMVLIALLILIASLMIGVPVAFSFLASTVFMVITQGYDTSFLLPYGFSKISSMVLLAVPLFIATGNLMHSGNIGDKLVDFVEVFVGRIKGGLGVVTIVTCAIFGSITGSAFATSSCIGSIMIPKLKNNGYSSGYIGALIANSAILGLLIPPSAIMILYAWIGRQSVLAAFLAIVAPGIMMVVLLSIINIFLLKKDPKIIIAEKIPMKKLPSLIYRKGYSALPAFVLPFLILGGIYSGAMTPTEAAAVGALYAIPVGFFVYKGLTWKKFVDTLIDSAITTGVLMVMLFSVMLLSRIYIMENLPGMIMDFLTSISSNRYVLMAMINVFMVIFGMLMDDVSAVLLCTPILLPIAVKLGIDPTQFAAIVAVNLGMGNVTPPTAPLLFVGGHLAGARIDEMMPTALIMIVFAWIPTLIVTTYVPGFATFLPNLILG